MKLLSKQFTTSRTRERGNIYSREVKEEFVHKRAWYTTSNHAGPRERGKRTRVVVCIL